MKNKVFNLFMILAASAVMFTACKKEYAEPPIQVLPVGTVYTIGEILQMESGTVFTEDASVYGIITADEQSGNLYKCAFMQDRATGDAIELYLNAVSGVRIGDSVRIYLKDVTYTMYNNLPQLSNFEADGHIIILANNKPIQPELTTIANINAGRHLAGLVRLENVKFTEQNTFAEPTTYGNRTLADPTNYSQTVIVRTSNYANFAYDSLPQGTGNLIAIASVYGSTWQLYIRSARELEFNGYTPGGGGDADLPYYQDFTTSFGTYTTYDVEGAQKWEIDYSTAKMTGYVGGNNYANEDWLISKKVSFENVTEVSMTMSYIARYFNSLNDDVTIQVSKDYTSGDPREATWKCMTANLVEGSNWTEFASTTIDLSEFAGEKVTVAVKYLSTEQRAGTIEVQSILIQEGSTPTPPTPGTGIFSETFASGQGSFTIQDVLLPSELTYVWQHAPSYSCMKASAYVGQAYATESWLVSPAIDLSGVNGATLKFEQAVNYASPQGALSVMISTDYNGDVNLATWTELALSQWPSGSDWTFISSAADLNPFVGHTVYIAFKYTSTSSSSATWEVKNVVVE